MAQRYGRNQKRAAREKIAILESTIRRLDARLYFAEKKAHNFDAKGMLLKRLAGQLGPQVIPYITEMMASDVRGRAHRVLTVEDAYLPTSPSGARRLVAHFDLRAIIDIAED